MLIRKPTILIAVTPVITAGAYATGKQLGPIQKLSQSVEDSTGTAFLRNITVIDKSKQKIAIDFFFFSDLPVGVTADTQTADVPVAEMISKSIGVVSVAAASYADLANSSVANSTPGNFLAASLKNSPHLYVIAVARGSATYASTDALTFKFGIEKN